MDKKELLKRLLLINLNEIPCVKATCKDSLLKICVAWFEPMWVPLESETYSADFLPPLPPLQNIPIVVDINYDEWDQVLAVLKEWYLVKEKL